MEARNQSSAGAGSNVPPNAGGIENDVSQNQSDLGRRNKGFKMEDLSEEEQRVLRECQRDSLFYRSLPLSAGCIVGVQYMVKTGRWAPHPQFGAIPKTIAFGFLGYMLGKLSYLPNCQQKIREQIPNSTLAAAMKGKSGITQPKDSETTQWESQPLKKSQENYDAFNQTPSTSAESAVPDGIDDRFRPTVDSNSTNENVPDEGQKKITYEEMRRRNRQQYDDNKAKQPPKQPGTPSYRDSPLMPQRPWPDARDRQPGSRDSESSEPMPSPPPPQGPPKRKRTNMWGDVIDD